MSKCRCGCGEEVEEGKQFLKGHWSKFNAKKNLDVPKPEEPKQTDEPKITISNIISTSLIGDEVAWFKTENGYIYREINFYCTVANENLKESASYVAVVLDDGLILPVVMIPGFAGIFPNDHEFIKPEIQKSEEKEPIPVQEPPRKILPAGEKPPISQPDEPIDVGIEAMRKMLVNKPIEKKQSFIGKLLGHATG